MGKKKVKWYKQKTTWAGIAALASVGGAYAAGELGTQQAIVTGVLSLITALFPENRVMKRED